MVDEQITDHCLSTAAANEADPVLILKLVVDESCQEALHHALLSSGTSPARALDAVASILGQVGALCIELS